MGNREIEDTIQLQYIKLIYDFYYGQSKITETKVNGSIVSFFYSDEYDIYERKYKIITRKEKIKKLINENSTNN